MEAEGTTDVGGGVVGALGEGEVGGGGVGVVHFFEHVVHGGVHDVELFGCGFGAPVGDAGGVEFGEGVGFVAEGAGDDDFGVLAGVELCGVVGEVEEGIYFGEFLSGVLEEVFVFDEFEMVGELLLVAEFGFNGADPFVGVEAEDFVGGPGHFEDGEADVAAVADHADDFGIGEPLEEHGYLPEVEGGFFAGERFLVVGGEFLHDGAEEVGVGGGDLEEAGAEFFGVEVEVAGHEPVGEGFEGVVVGGGRGGIFAELFGDDFLEEEGFGGHGELGVAVEDDGHHGGAGAFAADDEDGLEGRGRRVCGVVNGFRSHAFECGHGGIPEMVQWCRLSTKGSIVSNGRETAIKIRKNGRQFWNFYVNVWN